MAMLLLLLINPGGAGAGLGCARHPPQVARKATGCNGFRGRTAAAEPSFLADCLCRRRSTGRRIVLPDSGYLPFAGFLGNKHDQRPGQGNRGATGRRVVGRYY
jgi:hypothetical protein